MAEFILISLPVFNQKLLVLAILSIGDLFMSARDYIKAANLYYFAIRTGIFTRHFSMQCRALQSLGRALSRLVYRQMALRCFIKALEFAFKDEDTSEELAIYDHLSKLFFEANDLKTAVYFHKK